MMTELMFFGGLISAFLILKAGVSVWPPLDQPRLPIMTTGINTALLLISGYTMFLAAKAVHRGHLSALNRWLAITGMLGGVFLAIQGMEWVRLVGYGLTVSSSIYGGTFYTLIGAHGLHVIAAVVAVLFVLSRALRGDYSVRAHTGVTLCQVYWYFVVAIWPVIYILVYLS